MRWIAVVLLVGCKAHDTSATEIADRGWQAHELVVGAGERAESCEAAGLAMQRVFTEHRQAFVDAVGLDRDPKRLAEATEFIEANDRRYRDLELRMEALGDRCAADPSVQAAFRLMEAP